MKPSQLKKLDQIRGREKPQAPSNNIQVPKIIPVQTDSDGQIALNTSTNTTKGA